MKDLYESYKKKMKKTLFPFKEWFNVKILTTHEYEIVNKMHQKQKTRNAHI